MGKTRKWMLSLDIEKYSHNGKYHFCYVITSTSLGCVAQCVDWQTFPVLRSTCSWLVTTYVGKPSTVGQPTRPTQLSSFRGRYMSSRLQLDVRNLSLGRHHLVNAYEVKAGIGVIAGKTAWSMPEHLACNTTRGQSNLTKSASRGAHSPVRGHPRGSKVIPLNSWGRVSY